MIKYLVAAEYPDASPTSSEFLLDRAALSEMGSHVLFGACEQVGNNRFKTLGSSRVLAVGTTYGGIQSDQLGNQSMRFRGP